jgi:hypothetical protein
MTSKRETLATLTREQLKDLAKQYGIPFEHPWTKEQLVESIASSHSITIEGINALHEKIAGGGMLRPQSDRLGRIGTRRPS